MYRFYILKETIKSADKYFVAMYYYLIQGIVWTTMLGEKKN